ncbi:nucleoside 2-deoxyribosyltransferase domain-containing protein [Pseudomonas aeruginosa]|uniref:nucleoside 2-deoxyribosyltransferase domain-containing protein n=1 Tax=Pseudomonas aeruginosa TaxID=287 RepID=UPI003D2D2079
MPSKSLKQAKLMRAAAKSAEFAKKIGISQVVAQHWYEEDKNAGWFDDEHSVSGESLASPSVPPRPFVFLGGTCNGTTWRDLLIPELTMEYFNPVVEVWDAKAKAAEDAAKANAALMLFVITPMMQGVYSIAELVESSILYPSGTLVYIAQLDETPGGEVAVWNKHQTASNNAVLQLVERHGASVAKSLKEVALFINTFGQACAFGYEDTF